jgi:formylglycine-generating enzyme required for sulfatase activity
MRELLFERERDKLVGISRDTLEAALKALAFTMLEERPQETPTRGYATASAGVQTDLSREDAERMMSPALNDEILRYAQNDTRRDRATAEDILNAARDLQFIEVVRVDRDFPDLDRVRFRHQRWMGFWAALQIALNQTPRRDRFNEADWQRFCGQVWRESQLPNRRQAGVGASDPLPPPPPTGWEEVILLLAGFHPQADVFVRDLLKVNPILAARCIHEGRANVSDAVRQEVIRALLNIIGEGDAPAEPRGSAGASPSRDDIALRVRIAAGELLGELGDPRFPVDEHTGLILPPMVKIPAVNKFIMGCAPDDIKRYKRQLGDRFDEGGARDNEKPREVSLNAYAIGKYPVTNREFRQFVEDGGYTDRWKHCWTDGGWEWLQRERYDAPRYWNDERFNQPNSPVVSVTWFEAVAYANWLTAKMDEILRFAQNDTSGDRQHDTRRQRHSERSGRTLASAESRRFRLPSEAEWEYAARGEGRRLWAWGDGPTRGELTDEELARRCNIYAGDNFVLSTTPVGIYPLGATPNGMFDMAGNVWEWCQDWWDERQTGRVVRGGSWGNEPDGARAGARSWNHPDDRWNVNAGFRVAQCRS